ncbi:MAG: site-specific integrase [Deltaproteobacteria bacterium]|nr:site-specific integrase [Deltaproteobacteria bacterium]
MSKPKKVILSNGQVVWETRHREAGRGSREIRRRFATSKQAQDFLDDFRLQKRNVSQGFLQAGRFEDTTFEMEAQYWLEDLRLRVSPGHYERVTGIIEQFNKSFGTLRPNQITTEFLTRLQRRLKMTTVPARKSSMRNATVNRWTEAIGAVLNFSASQKRIPYNPVAGFRKLPDNSPEMLFWDEKEACSFLCWVNSKYTVPSNQNPYRARQYYVVYLLALNTAMRAGEIWGLKPLDLFFNENGVGDTLFIRRQINMTTNEYAPLKGGVSSDKDKSRHVPCPQELRKELGALIRDNRIRADDPLFQTTAGSFIHHEAFRDRFERDLANWGGRRIRFHDLRHTAATLMLAKGVDVKTVSEILGHENLSTTMSYVHLLGDRIKQVSRSYCIVPSQIQRPKLHLVTNP